VTPEEQTAMTKRVQERLNQALAYLQPRDPRYRYWQSKDGRMFVYTTERFSDGKYGSAVYVPTGKGARSGRKNVEQWDVRQEVHHSTRKAAKARALRLYEQWTAR
jgi:hypothetical protein